MTTTDQECAACGHAGMELMESSRVPDGLGWRGRLHGRHTRRYLRCPSCQARENPPAAAGSPSGRALGWVAVMVLVFVTLGLTVALAGMLLLVSLPLALVAVAAVLAATGFIIWSARRTS